MFIYNEREEAQMKLGDHVDHLRIFAISKFVSSCIVMHECRRYDCPVVEEDGEKFFRFLNKWHRLEEYTDELTDRG